MIVQTKENCAITNAHLPRCYRRSVTEDRRRLYCLILPCLVGNRRIGHLSRQRPLLEVEQYALLLCALVKQDFYISAYYTVKSGTV